MLPIELSRWRKVVYALDRVVLFLGDWFETLARFVGVLLIFYSVVVDKMRNAGILSAGIGLIAIEFAHKERLETLRLFCIRCGAERDGTGEFCPVCGEKYWTEAVKGVPLQ